MDTFKPIIGLEVHVELATASKMFCGCPANHFGREPNTQTCPVCLGLPGALPVPNKKAVEWTIMLGLALGCTVNEESKFDRKHYFYPDLAKGYQISQYDQPLCENGVVHTELGDVRIHRVHLEEDTGKLQHTTIDGKRVSLIDFNRSGVPLVEIVTEPDIHSAEHAKAYAKQIHEIVRTLEISDADMEKGSMRLEANISLADDPNVLPNYKVEVKNINSFRFLEHAITFEIARQDALLNDKKIPAQETRGWNEEKRTTIVQRSKENAEDYRYFPDPDLPPMTFDAKYVEKLRAELPMLPEEKIKKLEDLGIKPEFAQLLSSSEFPLSTLETLFTAAKGKGFEPNQVASVIINRKLDIRQVKTEHVLEILANTYTKDEVDPKELESAVSAVLEEQPKAVADYKAGKTQVIGFLIGMVSKKLGKKVSPKLLSSILVRMFSSKY
ncbi:MAG TPA: Asp-tRNA(Asn)/Glu-tRNA(Gln) amidotransferase GatCAB subunit B [Candidatus Pacebacteria bacterium]|nr:Asp-tRNA(Asn)/Glu-tRNA(Gln) amidotransferase GatCAB subunit B [Candidatus Paceibacterota bacterium]